MEALAVEDRPIAVKLLLMATELEQIAEDIRSRSPRRN